MEILRRAGVLIMILIIIMRTPAHFLPVAPMCSITANVAKRPGVSDRMRRIKKRIDDAIFRHFTARILGSVLDRRLHRLACKV